MKTATFSNGFQDTYKGKRDVKAAWATFNAAGEVIASGHSIDWATAHKTALADLRACAPGAIKTWVGGSYMISMLKDLGIESKPHNVERLVKAHNSTVRNAWVSACRIEVVEI